MPPTSLIQTPLPQTLNRLNVAWLRTILEEKRLFTKGLVDRYPQVWNTIKFHKFDIFTLTSRLLHTSWVRKLYNEYGKLVTKGKKKDNSFALLDFIMVQGRRVKCNTTNINEVPGCTMNVIHLLVDQTQKNTLD